MTTNKLKRKKYKDTKERRDEFERICISLHCNDFYEKVVELVNIYEQAESWPDGIERILEDE